MASAQALPVATEVGPLSRLALGRVLRVGRNVVDVPPMTTDVEPAQLVLALLPTPSTMLILVSAGGFEAVWQVNAGHGGAGATESLAARNVAK